MDFLQLFALHPQEPFASMSIWLTWFSAVLFAAMLLMAFLRIRPLRKEYRDVLNPLVSQIFFYAFAGYFLVIFRLSEVPLLSSRLLYIVWAAAFVYMLYRNYLKLHEAMRLVQRIVANRERNEAQKIPEDPYLAAYKKGKKKK